MAHGSDRVVQRPERWLSQTEKSREGALCFVLFELPRLLDPEGKRQALSTPSRRLLNRERAGPASLGPVLPLGPAGVPRRPDFSNTASLSRVN